MTKTTTTQAKTVGAHFHCLECGQKFRTLRAAERASFGPEGCPGCGGSDIEFGDVCPPDPPVYLSPAPVAVETAAERIARIHEEAMARS